MKLWPVFLSVPVLALFAEVSLCLLDLLRYVVKRGKDQSECSCESRDQTKFEVAVNTKARLARLSWYRTKGRYPGQKSHYRTIV